MYVVYASLPELFSPHHSKEWKVHFWSIKSAVKCACGVSE